MDTLALLRTKDLIITMTFLLSLTPDIYAQDSLKTDCNLKIELTVHHVSCKGSDDGAVMLHVENAVSPVFKWSNGDQSQDLMLVTMGQYSVTVTDGDCSVSGIVNVLEPSSDLILAVQDIEQVSCFDASDGRITLLASGGTEPYEFRLEGGNASQSGNEFDNLYTGDHTFYVQDRNGCEASAQGIIEEPAETIIDLGNDLQVESGKEIVLEVGPDFKEYLWSTGEITPSISFIREVSSVIEEIVTVEVWDENGCNRVSNPLKITIVPAADQNNEAGEIQE